ncbi:hypothetical protein [Pseudooceanicola sp. LIPI14-2-Ac024]|uniref:hypothetical protein n=1 Tax=Pseudooceanicola sp. LIPI14-2-Ac024 TaxID=3344875 RepID=UPI0035CEEDD6
MNIARDWNAPKDPWNAPMSTQAVHLQFAAMVIFLVAVAVFFPITDDEWWRLGAARDLRATGAYDFFWPPLSVVLLVVNPALDLGPVAVRLFNLALTLPVFYALAALPKSRWQIALLALMLPYMALVVSTASQQGMMIATLGWLVLRSAMPWWGKALLLGAGYAINPTLIVLVPLAFAALVLLRRAPLSDLGAAGAAYLLTIPWAIWAWSLTGDILPTLSVNGPYNLFLGNNPDPLSHRGVGEIDVAWQALGLSGAPDYGSAVRAYLAADPVGFAGNLATKAVLFIAPVDHMRSGLGAGFEAILFSYFAVVEIALYTAVVLHLRRHGPGRAMAVALALFAAAWLIYTAFFVKVRFRIPFDALLLFCLLAPERSAERDR